MPLFETGGQFPPEDHIERIAKYKRMKKFFEGKQLEVYERASELLKDSPQAPQLERLYIAINLPYLLTLKPADLLIGDRPIYEAGLPDKSPEQQALNSYVEENDLNTLIYESATSNGYRGDSFVKVRYGYRQDFTEVQAALSPDDFATYMAAKEMEPIIEHVRADCVFPETAAGNIKQFKAVNIANIEWVETAKREVPFLNVERHVPGFILYERYRLHERPEIGVISEYGVPITTYTIGEQVASGKDVEATGLPHIPVFHVPYTSVDDDWRGQGFVEKIASSLQALEDRIVQLDYILLKHADPTLYGPDISGPSANTASFGGKYIPITKEDATPGAITWNGHLESVFKEIDLLLSYIYQMSETPQWLFGTTISGGGNAGGSGTSHTDGAGIKARFMPILSKVKRIRNHYDKAVKDALWTCFLFDEQFGGYKGGTVYPTIHWKDGLPKNEKEEAEIAQIRTGGKATLAVMDAIKRQDEVDDDKALEIMRRIADDDETAFGTVDASIFNEPQPAAEVTPVGESNEEPTTGAD
ncbi:portal protein [uncultured Planococcus sp.]|uniref:portal protein n=1 Tax=uncultured Planococcus sp. TaxID=337815 RepID=UPI002637B55D|nr:portal protein [uncultured Planococcus sp.]